MACAASMVITNFQKTDVSTSLNGPFCTKLTRLKDDEIKTNIRKYMKFMKKKQFGARQIDKINQRINCLSSDVASTENNALIHSLQIIRDDVLEYESDDESTSSEE